MKKKKVVLIVDSFKGSLSSAEVERAAEKGIHELCENCEVECLPVADGGEGMLDVMIGLSHGKKEAAEVHDALMRPVTAHYGVMGDGKTAVVEMAQASGLPLLTVEERNPMLTTSYGTGELIAKAIAAGYRKIVLGIGGSATHDGGMGMMQALGARFLDEAGNVLPIGCGNLLKAVSEVDLGQFNRNIAGVHFVTACDVANPLCGPRGAACVFAPQKGASPEMVLRLDEGMAHFGRLMERISGKQILNLPGAGAAGGLGACLHAFFQSALLPGIDLILDEMQFRAHIADASLVITGEGKADRQTLMGKVPAGVLRIAKTMGVRVALLVGAVEDSDLLLNAGFSRIVAVSPKEMPLAEAMRPERARENIRNAVVDLLDFIHEPC